MDNNIRICQGANTIDISIENKIRIYQVANTYDISIEKRQVSVKQLTHLISVWITNYVHVKELTHLISA
jgi:hypothetical protein